MKLRTSKTAWRQPEDEVTTKSDVFSLRIAVHELATGRIPRPDEAAAPQWHESSLRALEAGRVRAGMADVLNAEIAPFDDGDGEQLSGSRCELVASDGTRLSPRTGTLGLVPVRRSGLDHTPLTHSVT
jgi:hypothetical protein